MKIDKEFLNKIYYNGDLNKKQLDILNIDFSSEKNYENEILGKEYENLLSKNSLLSDSIIAYRKIPIDKTNDKFR